jgi:hypothetical protein
MVVAKAGGDTAVKTNAAPAVIGAFRRCMDNGGGGKVGGNGRGGVDNRQQWQWQSGSIQLKVMVASSGIDYCGVRGKRQGLTVIGSKMPTGKAIVIAPSTPWGDKI